MLNTRWLVGRTDLTQKGNSYYQVTVIFILGLESRDRINKRLENKFGEHIKEKRGWHWD